MQEYRFKTVIPESGVIKLPVEIGRRISSKSVEIVILEEEGVEAELLERRRRLVRELKGSFAGRLSSSEDFCRRKALEKRKDEVK